MEINKIYNEDCLATLAKMEDNSVDLVVTSPPYNKGFYAVGGSSKGSNWTKMNGRKIAYDEYSDDMNPEDYEQWQTKVISECIRVLKPTGSLFYNHKDIINHGVIVHPKWVYNFKIKQEIIWDRQSTCMLDPHYFIPAYEWIFWLVKDEKNVFFNKKESVFKTNIWRMNAEKNPHPAPFPQIMAGNIINCCSKESDLVYDPFMGSGTTAICAIKSKRNYIGSEISPNYVAMAEKRIKQETQQLSLF